jgi:SAM-dependent methyltransferase
MNNFIFREHDEDGKSTLEVIAKADHFNRWMYQSILPFCFGKILEIGSGIGNISSFFIKDGYQISLSDIRQNYCQYLEGKYGENQNVGEVLRMDLISPNFRKQFEKFEEKFDTVFALNVVEHINNDLLAIENCRFLLKKGGHLIILVPAYMWLYNGFDEALGHMKRYDKKSLHQLFISNSMEIIKSRYFNLAGILGWYVSGKLQKNQTIPDSQMKLYDSLVPLFKLLDKIILNSIGLSVITVGIKK